MIRNQLLEKSFNEYFKKQAIDQQQRELIGKCLKSSRYSKLSYAPRIDEFLSEKINEKLSSLPVPQPPLPPTTSCQKENDIEQCLESLVIGKE